MTPKKTKTKTKKKRPSRIQKNKLAKIFLLILLIALVASTFSYFMMKKESHKASKTVKIDNILEIKKQTDENQTPKNENTNTAEEIKTFEDAKPNEYFDELAKTIDKHDKFEEYTQEFEKEVMHPLAMEKRDIDLDKGAKHNYLLFGSALKKIVGLDSEE